MDETPTQVLANEICEDLFKTSFEERLRTTASGLSKRPTYSTTEDLKR